MLRDYDAGELVVYVFGTRANKPDRNCTAFASRERGATISRWQSRSNSCPPPLSVRGTGFERVAGSP